MIFLNVRPFKKNYDIHTINLKTCDYLQTFDKYKIVIQSDTVPKCSVFIDVLNIFNLKKRKKLLCWKVTLVPLISPI